MTAAFRKIILVAVIAVLLLSVAVLSTSGVAEFPAAAAENAVYIKGSAGLDVNGGTSENDAVATFSRAKELLDGSDGTIVVCGQLNVTGSETWEAGEGQRIKIVRADGFHAKVAAVFPDSSLYIKDMEISAGDMDGATEESYLVDLHSSAKLALGGRVIINDAPDGKNVHLPENSVIEVRAPLTGGEGSVCLNSDNPIGGKVFEHKVAKGARGYSLTEADAKAFIEVSDLFHSNIVKCELKDNAAVFSVTPENRIDLTLRLSDQKGNVISEHTDTVVKGSTGFALPAFSRETDGIQNVPKELTHVKSVRINGGENLVINKTDGTLSENRNEVVGIKGFDFQTTANGWFYRVPEARENSVLEVVYEPDAFAVSYDLCGGEGTFPAYLVPYGANNPDYYGGSSAVAAFTPVRRGFVFSGYAPSDGGDYSAMPAHDISYKAGWRISVQAGISGAATVKVGQVVALRSTATVYAGVDYSYFWYKDGKPVEGQNLDTLYLSKVEQSGSYVLQVVASDQKGFAPDAVATSAAVTVKIEKYGAGQEEKPDVPPTDIETEDPIPDNAVLSVVKLAAGNSVIKTPLGFRAIGRFFASLKAGGKDVPLEKTVTVKIKLDEKFLNDQSLCLIMAGKDGTPTYREFSIENGLLIFETDSLGEFALFVKTPMPWWAWIIVVCGGAAIVAAVVIFVLYIKSFLITFETDGGTQVKRKTVLGGAKVPKLPMPEKNGSDFAGWFLDEDRTQEFEFKKMPKSNMVLYAKWKPKFGEKSDKTLDPKEPNA